MKALDGLPDLWYGSGLWAALAADRAMASMRTAMISLHKTGFERATHNACWAQTSNLPVPVHLLNQFSVFEVQAEVGRDAAVWMHGQHWISISELGAC